VAPAASSLDVLVGQYRIGLVALGATMVALAVGCTSLAWRWLGRPLAAAGHYAAIQGRNGQPRPFAAGSIIELRRLRADLMVMTGEIDRREEAERLHASLRVTNARLESLLEGAPLAVVEAILDPMGAARIVRWRGRSAALRCSGGRRRRSKASGSTRSGWCR
jgi:hypothetical protein